jgi:hypothetical protein
MKTTLLNPFSHSLGKNPLMEVPSEPIFTTGDYKIYKYFDKHFVHTYKNIVITERGAADKDLLNNLKNNIKPTGEASIFHNFERPLGAKVDGLRIAQEINFTVK